MTYKLDHDLIRMPDGRSLYLYGPWKGEPSWPHLDQPKQVNTAHARWHPLRQEWVTYAAARQGRTYKPVASACPLCPNTPDGELPFDSFTLAVFENRFPSFQIGNVEAPDLSAMGIKTRPAKGACEVVVYCSAHAGNLATIPQENRELLCRVWGERRRIQMESDAISVVMPFENRGEEAGVTLHHPHGQIYSFEDKPPVIAKMADGFAKGYDLQKELKRYQSNIVFETETAAGFIPPFARFPYEMWLTTKAFRASPSDMTDAEIKDIADLLRRSVLCYDGFFERQTPYVMLVYMAPKGQEDSFPFHIQFYPFLRTKDRLKFLAGCEQGAGTFLADVLPETAAARLRKIGEKL